MKLLERRLSAGASELGLNLTPGQIDALLAYLALIEKWNKVYNLTAVREPAEMVTHHLLDSLAVVAPLLRQLDCEPEGGDVHSPRSVLDVGSGAGLPGVVIAISCPAIKVDCVDAVAKKVAFIQQVAGALRLSNLRGMHARVETLNSRYSLVCSRAFSSLSDFVDLSQGALAEGGIWMAMKGRDPTVEICALPKWATVFHVEPVAVPGMDAERCIVWMRRPNARTLLTEA